MSRDVGRELRGLRLVTGGQGVVCLTRRGGQLMSTAAYDALERAALRLGYARRRGGAWSAVVRALDDWALDDVISEAVEEQEAGR